MKINTQMVMPWVFILNFCMYQIIKYVSIFIVSSILFGCENDIEKINAITREPDYPVQTGYDVKLIYTDSTKLKTIIEAPEVHYYTFTEEPYYEFPKGFDIYMFDEFENEHYQITGNYGKALLEQNLWEARNNVIALNVQNREKLNTEQLFWDQENQKIYSDNFTKITNEDGVFYGEQGFESNESFTSWRLIGTKGTVNVNEETN